MIKDESIIMTKLRANIIIPKPLKKTLLLFGSYLKLPRVPRISSQLSRNRFIPQQIPWLYPLSKAGNSPLMLPQSAPQINPL